MSDRRSSTYKEEVLRYLHGMPRGQLQDRRLGVTRVLHDRLSSRYPLTLGTISGILGALAQEHRVLLEFGHRSLDNRHLITQVTVLAEPIPGVTRGPDEPPEPRGAQNPRMQPLLLDPAALVQMMRQIINKRLRNELVPLDTLQQVAAHVEHLVGELELYEQLIQEADEELMAKQAEWEVHERDWAQLVETTEAEAEEKINRAERTAEQLRTRSNQHFARIQLLTQQLEQVQAAEHAAQAELAEYHQRVSDLGKQLEQAGRDLQESHQQVLQAQARAEAARDHYHRVVQVAKLREQHLITENLRWAQLTNNVLLTLNRVHPGEVGVHPGLVDLVEQDPPDTWAAFLMQMAQWLRTVGTTDEPILQLADSQGKLHKVSLREYEEAAGGGPADGVLLVSQWLDQATAPLDADPAEMGWPAPEETQVRDAARAIDLDRQLRHMHRMARGRERLLTGHSSAALTIIQSLLMALRNLEQHPDAVCVVHPQVYQDLELSPTVTEKLVPFARWLLDYPWRLLRIMTTKPDWIRIIDTNTGQARVPSEKLARALSGLAREINRADYEALLDEQVGPLRLPDD